MEINPVKRKLIWKPGGKAREKRRKCPSRGQ